MDNLREGIFGFVFGHKADKLIVDVEDERKTGRLNPKNHIRENIAGEPLGTIVSHQDRAPNGRPNDEPISGAAVDEVTNRFEKRAGVVTARDRGHPFFRR